jgi:hypothetical protein
LTYQSEFTSDIIEAKRTCFELDKVSYKVHLKSDHFMADFLY